MSAFNDLAEIPTGHKEEYISPEGAIERIVYEHRFIMTSTSGGKYNMYLDQHIKGKGWKLCPNPEVFDDIDDAYRTMCGMMVVVGENQLSKIEEEKA